MKCALYFKSLFTTLFLFAFLVVNAKTIHNFYGQLCDGTNVYRISEASKPGFGATGSGTKADPFNAIAAYQLGSSLGANEKTADSYYIKGKVSYLQEQFGTQYGNATFYLSDDGTENNQFYIYRAYYFNNQKYNGESLLLHVGDEVVVYGKIMNYQGRLPETVQGEAYVVSINGVSLIASITINGNTTEPLTVGDTLQLSATVLPDNATDKSVTWSSSNASVATISSTGLVTAKGEGTTTIICKANDESGVQDSCVVTVNSKKPTSISIRSQLAMKIGDTYTISETVSPYDAAYTLTWSSDNTSVATVDKDGNVKAIGEGNAKVTVETDNGKTATCDVSVIKESVPLTDFDVAAISARSYHSMIVKTDGSLWACGWNSDGQLGDGTTTDKTSPVKVMEGVASVSAGDIHTMIVKTDGSLWACGGNWGRLGDGTITDKSTPIKVMERVTSASAGGNYTMIVKTDGSLWACGNNNNGQFGDGTTTNSYSPIKVMEGVAYVSANNNTLILKTDNSLWACGDNDYGQLGDGTTTSKSTPIKVMEGVASVSAGRYHTMIVKTDGSLWACGINAYGQLGDGTNMNRLTPVQISEASKPGFGATGSGTKADPFNAIAAYQLGSSLGANEKTADSYYIKGKVSYLQEQFGTQYGNATFYLSDDGTENNQFYIYRAYYFNNQKYNGESLLLHVGDEVVVYGKIMNYQGRLPETVQGEAYVVSINGETIEASKQGDVNGDDEVNGTDLVALSNIVLGRKEQTPAADVNKDGSVNGTDIVSLSNLILGRNKAPRRVAMEENASLFISPFYIKAGEEQEMSINLINPNDEITLVQFDLHLPEGLTIKKVGTEFDIDIADRTSWRKHTLDANEVDSAVRFLLYSSSNTVIDGTSGAIIKVKLLADNTFAGGKIVIDNTLLVSPDEKETKPKSYEYETCVSGIESVIMDNDPSVSIYNLSGQKLKNPQKGINIINRQKVLVK